MLMSASDPPATPPHHEPNPLDRILLATDMAWRRAGLAPADIHIHLVLGGEVPVGLLRQAVRRLYHRYPMANGRLVRRRGLRGAAWRLDSPAPDMDQVVVLHHLQPATFAEFERQAELLLHDVMDLESAPPVRIHVLRGLADGDRIILRWPHALMDARGGVLLMEELQTIFERGDEAPPPALDLGEFENDFERLLNHASLLQRARLSLRRAAPAARIRGLDRRLCASDPLPGERMRWFVREISVEEFREVRDASMRICGFARFADYLRACGVWALHQAVPPDAPGDVYSTLHLVDNRRRRQRGPLFHNVFSALPVRIPRELAEDRVLVADEVTRVTAEMVATGELKRRLASLDLLARAPLGVLAGLMRQGLHGKRSPLPLGLSRPPSLPMGFLGPFSRPMPEFCGAPLRNLYGLRPAAPRAGYVFNVNSALDRLNVAGVFFEPRLSKPTVNLFLDRFVAAMRDRT